MRDIIYITTAQENDEFENFKKGWKKTLNPSSVNFHNKMINALSFSNKVYVFSIRPYEKSCVNIDRNSKTSTINNIKYHYLKIYKNKYLRTIYYYLECQKIIKKLSLKNKPIIFVETMNMTSIYIAKKLNKKFNYPLIGILTDSPNYISFVSDSYKEKLLKECNDFNGYIALNDNLNTLYNIHNKPHIINEGLSNQRNIQLNKEINNGKPYFYYGGTLLKQFGIYELIEAYKKLNTDEVSLIISGHHENIDELNEAIKGCDIKYIGNLDMNKTQIYEENSLASINPRNVKEDIDKYSVPSKVIEYLSSRTIVISTKSTILHKIFKNEIIWLEEPIEDSLFSALKKVMEMSEQEKEEIKNNGYKKVNELYSLTKVNNKIDLFINNLF
ncbi:MAG: glycosyltransferase [Bacilli bacterium]